MTYKHLKKSLVLQGLIVSLFQLTAAQNVLPPYASLPTGSEPYPANPVGMQTYINKTIPNIAFVFDNSITMEIPMKDRTLPANRRPRRVDIVKDALLQIVDDYHDNFNFSYANITDYARDLHWKVDPSQPTGYDFHPITGQLRSKHTPTEHIIGLPHEQSQIDSANKEHQGQVMQCVQLQVEQ